MKIKLCLPAYTGLPLENLLKQFRNKKGHEFFACPESSSLLFKLRNRLVGKLDYDYYLFIDNDVAYSYRHFLRLLELDKPIANSACIERNSWNYATGEWDKIPGLIKNYPLGTTGVKKVDWCGMGFTLIKREVFEALEYPWFRHEFIEFEGKKDQTGEDVGFCMNAENFGFDIYCDFDFPVVHCA